MTREEIRQVIEAFLQELTLISKEENPAQSKKMLLGGKETTLDIILPRVQEKLPVLKPELPSNLDEAAQKVEDYYDVGEEHGYLCCHRGDIKDAFKAGAEWMAEQGVTFESFIDYYDGYYLDCGEQEQNAIEQLSLKVMDKAIVQIRKK